VAVEQHSGALATTLLSKTVALAEGVAVFAVLLLMQYAIAWGGTRSERFQRLESDGTLSTLTADPGPLSG